MKFTSIYLGCILLIIAIAGFINSKEDILEEIQNNCTSEIYEQVQVLLESN